MCDFGMWVNVGNIVGKNSVMSKDPGSCGAGSCKRLSGCAGTIRTDTVAQRE